jgi:hypothetical protein
MPIVIADLLLAVKYGMEIIVKPFGHIDGAFSLGGKMASQVRFWVK